MENLCCQRASAQRRRPRIMRAGGGGRRDGADVRSKRNFLRDRTRVVCGAHRPLGRDPYLPATCGKAGSDAIVAVLGRLRRAAVRGMNARANHPLGKVPGGFERRRCGRHDRLQHDRVGRAECRNAAQDPSHRHHRHCRPIIRQRPRRCTTLLASLNTRERA